MAAPDSLTKVSNHPVAGAIPRATERQFALLRIPSRTTRHPALRIRNRYCSAQEGFCCLGTAQLSRRPPEPDSSVTRARDKTCPIGQESQTLYDGLVPRQNCEALTTEHPPQRHSSIPRAGGQDRSIGRKGETAYRCPVIPQSPEPLAIVHAPKSRGPVPRSSGQDGAIG